MLFAVLCLGNYLCFFGLQLVSCGFGVVGCFVLVVIVVLDLWVCHRYLCFVLF